MSYSAVVNPQLWRQRPPPPALVGATVLGVWPLTRPADLSASRAQLRRAAAGDRRPADADSDDIDRLLLAFEELASNGLRHGKSPVRVQVTAGGRGWLIDANDAAAHQPPTPAVDRDPAYGGLGLHLVAGLCTAHGWWVHEERKHVWATLARA